MTFAAVQNLRLANTLGFMSVEFSSRVRSNGTGSPPINVRTQMNFRTERSKPEKNDQKCKIRYFSGKVFACAFLQPIWSHYQRCHSCRWAIWHSYHVWHMLIQWSPVLWFRGPLDWGHDWWRCVHTLQHRHEFDHPNHQGWGASPPFNDH